MGFDVEVIWPALDVSTWFAGNARFTWLNALKFSHRSSSVLPSVMRNSLASERLNTARRGPRSVPFPASPLRNGACGCVYTDAAGLNQSEALGLETCGLPMMSGRK